MQQQVKSLLKSSGDIEIVNSRLETMKGAASDAANPEKSNAYGNITILADKILQLITQEFTQLHLI